MSIYQAVVPADDIDRIVKVTDEADADRWTRKADSLTKLEAGEVLNLTASTDVLDGVSRTASSLSGPIVTKSWR